MLQAGKKAENKCKNPQLRDSGCKDDVGTIEIV
jgi:hypothetical protein